jgi:hypothetical protein
MPTPSQRRRRRALPLPQRKQSISLRRLCRRLVEKMMLVLLLCNEKIRRRSICRMSPNHAPQAFMKQ